MKNLDKIINEALTRFLMSETTDNNKSKFKTVPLTKEFINQHASEANMLNHMQLDAKGIAYMDDNTLVGYVGYKGSWIVGIYVKPKYRRQGIGSKLIKYAIKHGANKSTVNKQNIASLNFHQNNNFKIYKFDTNIYYLKKI